MYDGSTNPAEWLEVYQLTIEVIGRDSYVMANYLPIFLSSLARIWLMPSWSDLCWKFISVTPGVTVAATVHLQWPL
jgi:hypothetical protein